MAAPNITYWAVFGNGCAYEHTTLDAAIEDIPDSTTKDGILKITRAGNRIVAAEPVQLVAA